MTQPRFRQTDNRVPSSYLERNWDGAGNFQDQQLFSTGRHKSGSYKSISDVYDPEYFKKKAKGEVILHPVSIRTDDRSCVDSHWSFGHDPTWGTRSYDGSVACETFLSPTGVGVSHFLANVEVAKDLALVEAYAKMNSPDVLFSVFYAERGKTAAMLHRPFKGAIDHLERIIARKGRLVARGLTAVAAGAQAWLELRYGWRPLMYDVAGIITAAGHAKPEAGQLLIARGGKFLEYLEEGIHTDIIPGLTGMNRKSRWQYEARVNSGVCYKYRDLSDAEWRNRCLGLTLDNVPSHVWETILLSFVVDYFVKVGSWLRAITPNPDVVVCGNWTSTKLTNINSMEIIDATISVATAGNPVFVQSGGRFTETLVNFDREINRSLPATPPMEVNKLSFLHAVDIAALLLGRIHLNLGRLRL